MAGAWRVKVTESQVMGLVGNVGYLNKCRDYISTVVESSRSYFKEKGGHIISFCFKSLILLPGE